MDNLISIMEEIGIPFAYDHFAEGESPEPPFICFLCPGSDNFAADGWAYFKVDTVHIELYTDEKNPGIEARVEAVLDIHGIFFEKTEVWIESERLYEVLYSFELEVKTNEQPTRHPKPSPAQSVCLWMPRVIPLRSMLTALCISAPMPTTATAAIWRLR